MHTYIHAYTQVQKMNKIALAARAKLALYASSCSIAPHTSSHTLLSRSRNAVPPHNTTTHPLTTTSSRTHVSPPLQPHSISPPPKTIPSISPAFRTISPSSTNIGIGLQFGEGGYEGRYDGEEVRTHSIFPAFPSAADLTRAKARGNYTSVDSSGQHTATHCNTLQHTATHHTPLHHTAPHRTTLQHTHSTCACQAARMRIDVISSPSRA